MARPNYIIGVDPGTQGGLAIISIDGSEVIVTGLKKLDLPSIARQFALWSLWGKCQVYMEKVHSFPGEGVTSAHTFGKSNGRLEMAAVCNGMEIVYVQPQVWQRGMALGKVSGHRKKAHKAKAEKLWPNLKGITLENADALLIAEYGRRQ